MPALRRIRTLSERFWPKVDKSDRCWLWKASLDGKGYGQINAGRTPTKMRRAHRVAYELCVGAIPDGMDLDHLCRNTRCVNPSHLEPVSRRTNLLRGNTITAHNASVTHCPSGHSYSGHNLYINKRGKRFCRECNRLHAVENRAAQRRRNERTSY